MKVTSVILLLGVVPSTLGHICMWQPPQREGAFQISTPGESVCYLKEGPCGGVPSGNPTTQLQGGQRFDILFQQNLNHFYLEDPGELVADFAMVANPTEEDFTTSLGNIVDFNAMNEITQTNFTLSIKVPNIDCEHCVVRMRYVSKNPTENDRGTTFYQCSDVSVASTDGTDDDSHEREDDSVRGGNDCCAPQQFTLQGYETGSWRQPTQHMFYVDGVNQLVRVDTISGTGTTPIDGHFQMFSNFSSGREYYYNVATGTCDIYGLNMWSDWCYGSYNSQKYMGSVHVGHELADTWSGGNNGFVWSNIRRDCMPMSKYRSTGEITTYYNMVIGAPDLGVFEAPSVCFETEAKLGDAKLPISPRKRTFDQDLFNKV